MNDNDTATQHLVNCIERARPYLPDQPHLAYTSLTSDLAKHEGTRHLRPDAETMMEALIHSNQMGAAAMDLELAAAQWLAEHPPPGQ